METDHHRRKQYAELVAGKYQLVICGARTE